LGIDWTLAKRGIDTKAELPGSAGRTITASPLPIPGIGGLPLPEKFFEFSCSDIFHQGLRTHRAWAAALGADDLWYFRRDQIRGVDTCLHCPGFETGRYCARFAEPFDLRRG
jgi:hypothetical protein